MFVNNVAFPAPRLKARIRPSRSGTLWVGSTYPSSGRVSGSTDRKAQKPAAPSFAEEIHLSTEVTCCFWPWPHSFLRCFPPERSRILPCDRTIPGMYVRTPRNLCGDYSSLPIETALGSFSVVLSAIESDGNMFCSGRSKPSARKSFECLRVGAEPCALGLPIPANRPARTPLLPPQCHRIFGRSRSVRKSICA